MRLLGIDPGVATTGYGLLEQIGDKMVLLDYGVFTTWPRDPLSKRLLELKNQFHLCLETWKPDHLALERLFFNQNVNTALSVGMASGVLIVTAEEYAIPTFEYTPLQVKQGLTGYGRADKRQIQSMVKSLLNLSSLPKPDDAADAVAIALCHAHSFPMQEKIQMAEWAYS